MALVIVGYYLLRKATLSYTSLGKAYFCEVRKHKMYYYLEVLFSHMSITLGQIIFGLLNVPSSDLAHTKMDLSQLIIFLKSFCACEKNCASLLSAS